MLYLGNLEREVEPYRSQRNNQIITERESNTNKGDDQRWKKNQRHRAKASHKRTERFRDNRDSEPVREG